MIQTTESGRQGNEVGRFIGQKIAEELDMTLENGSNKGIYSNKNVVIKSARLGNSQFGITNKMLQEIEFVILAKEIEFCNFDIYLVDIQSIISHGRPTKSKGSSAGKVTNFSVSKAMSSGSFIKHLYIQLPHSSQFD